MVPGGTHWENVPDGQLDALFVHVHAFKRSSHISRSSANVSNTLRRSLENCVTIYFCFAILYPTYYSLEYNFCVCTSGFLRTLFLYTVRGHGIFDRLILLLQLFRAMAVPCSRWTRTSGRLVPTLVSIHFGSVVGFFERFATGSLSVRVVGRSLSLRPVGQFYQASSSGVVLCIWVQCSQSWLIQTLLN